MATEFRLKRLHELRQREVEHQTLVLSEVQDNLQRLNDSARALETDLERQRTELVEVAHRGLSVAQLKQQATWMRSMLSAHRDLAQRCHEAGHRVERQREALLELHRDERVLERLEERHRALTRAEELRLLERELDDARTREYSHPRGGEHDE